MYRPSPDSRTSVRIRQIRYRRAREAPLDTERKLVEPVAGAPVIDRGPLRPFASPAFRYLWLNSFAFALIQSTQRFAYVWLVLELGGGARGAGLVSFALGIPILLFSLPSGVLSDRMDRRVLLFASQIGAMTITVVTALLIATGRITIPITYGLAVVLGTTLALGQPVRQAIVPSIVQRDRLMSAIALMTLGMNVSMIAGPALGGGVIAIWGLGGAFAVQAAVYGFALLALVPLRLPDVVAARADRHLGRELSEGLRFIRDHRGILALVGLLTASGFLMIGPVQALLPHIARERLGRDALQASLLFASTGSGMLITSLVLASRARMRNKGLWFTANLILGGLFSAAIGLSTSYPLTMVLMFGWGLGGGLFINLNQTLIQTNTPPPLMGRVMSVHTLAFMGIGPIGALVAGAAAEAIGAWAWFTACGFALSGVALIVFLTQPVLRRMP